MATTFQRTISGVPAAVDVSPAIDVNRASQKAVQTSGTFAATYDVEGSLDGTNFAAVPNGSGLTAPAVVDIPGYYRQLRINVTAYTSGAIVAKAAGLVENR